MAPLLGWSEAEQAAQLADALEHIASFGGPLPRNTGASAQPEQSELREVFAALDTDADGFIGESEVAAALAAVRELEDLSAKEKCSLSPQDLQHSAAAAFRQMDSEVTGRVSFSDFDKWFHDEARSQQSGGDDAELRSKLMLSAKKLGEGGSSGVAFG